jgi:hypothetical protein
MLGCTMEGAAGTALASPGIPSNPRAVAIAKAFIRISASSMNRL